MAQQPATATDPPLPPFESLAKSQKKEYLDARSQEDVAADGRAQAGRKKLAEQTKAFRGYVTSIPASSDEQLMTHFGTLLKAYQQEVDSLTKRARAAEGALQYVAPWIRSTVDAPPVAPPPTAIDVSKFQLEIEALNETLEDKELQAQVLRAERDKMAAALQNAEKANVDLAANLIAAKKEITTLGEALAAKDAQYAEEIERLNGTAVTLQSDLSAAVARAEDIVASSQRREGELRHKCAALEASITEAEARAQSAVSKANESTVQLQQRDEELHNKAKEISALTEELNHVRLNLSQLEVARPTTTEETHHSHHPHQPQHAAPKEEALIVLEAVGGIKDSGAALHQHLHAHPHTHPGQSHSQPPSAPSVTAKLLTDEEDDAWGWKDDEDKPTAPAPAPASSPAAAPAPVVPMVTSVRVEAAVPVPPSPVKSSPALVSASELQSNIAQLMVREDASEEELEKLEDMHHEQLRKIARAKWQLLKRQVLGNRH